ncbi:Sodium:neurotransmitter symporter family protein [Oesophagostomum dentatum]|uniref:Sodium:neurotransmitter symporter family protein n=1 Tax=Oesophagostomum dentatum TaxID=61180 RepID=A0A0B1T9X5_OESDE|nr:Sodium:neurotransmitter symporter family protein [Oesophagostomum dentatum]
MTTEFAGIEALITGLCDESRLLARKREWFVAIVCVLYYFGSLPAISYGGQYVIPFLDEYGVSLSVLFIVTCEMVAVCWFYGIDRFSNDIKTMLGFYPGLYWRICWMMCPIFISVIFIMTVWHASLAPMQLPGYTFPTWSVGLGWFLRLLSVLSVPLFALYMLSYAKGTLAETFTSILPETLYDDLVIDCEEDDSIKDVNDDDDKLWEEEMRKSRNVKGSIRSSDFEVSEEMVGRAAAFYTSAEKGSGSLSCVQKISLH